MATAMYGKGRENFAKGLIHWDADDIKAALIDTGTYTVQIDTHEYYSDLSGVVGTPVSLATKTQALGVLDAANTTIVAVAGATVEAIVIYQDTGNPATSRLIAYIDNATGLPITPNGSDILIAWSNGANKILKL